METSLSPFKRYTLMAHTASLMAILPFDMAREVYAKLVQLKFVEHSLLGSARFGRDLQKMEKLTLLGHDKSDFSLTRLRPFHFLSDWHSTKFDMPIAR